MDRVGARDVQLDAASAHHALRERALQGEHRTRAFGIAQVGAHQGVAVDDSRGGRVQARHAVQLRFHRASLRRARAHDIGDAVGVRSLADALQVLHLRGVCGDDQLAAAPVGHSTLGAVGVQALPTLQAGARLE